MVLLAGFLRNRQYYGKATVMVEQALAEDLPDDMRGIAEDLRAELAKLRAPRPVVAAHWPDVDWDSDAVTVLRSVVMRRLEEVPPSRVNPADCLPSLRVQSPVGFHET